MKRILTIATITILTACNNQQTQTDNTTINSIQGTWKLISGTTIEKNDTAVTDYTKDKSFIKVINATHFAFMGHDLNKGKDSATTFFSSGGGEYELNDCNYTEHLEYCNAREWEGNDFHFTITINNDTLTQQGIEKIDSIGVNRINIEKYIRLK
ncbi:lipocalin-like domain-containing protein [Parafilimonas terrae]|uniref:Lipocalin-like domain-containing protein n=1 Tax=Parafilimonas terrae TaxID=1465490 RepID=A0A1I5Z6L0_9BACT|nr:hypothetical protein [Parafilimonas terrae]SFQ52098.1 hypothetical protein SAMN05444277_11718 [Parafilimonas terrae]